MADNGWMRISLIEHYAYCPRQAQLLDDGVWADNHLTVQGDAGHERVDAGGIDRRRGVRVHHRVTLVSRKHRVHGIADAIEQRRDGTLMPVEHKRGRGAGDLFPSIAQAVAQAICLEEMLATTVPLVAVYVTSEHRREEFETSDYRTRVTALISEIHTALDSPITARYQRRLCSSCSIRNACQPLGQEWL